MNKTIEKILQFLSYLISFLLRDRKGDKVKK